MSIKGLHSWDKRLTRRISCMLLILFCTALLTSSGQAESMTYKELWDTELHYEKIIKEIEGKSPSQLRQFTGSSSDFLSSTMGDASLLVDLGTMGHLDRINPMFDSGKGYFDGIAMGLGLLSKLMEANTGEEYYKAFNDFSIEYSMTTLTNVVSNIVGPTAALPAAVISWFLKKVESIVIDSSEENLWKRYQEIHEELLSSAMRPTLKAHLAQGTLEAYLDKVWEIDDLRVYTRGASLVDTWVRMDTNLAKSRNLPEKFRTNFIVKHKDYIDGVAMELMQERALAYQKKLAAELKAQLESVKNQLNRSLRFQFALIDPRTGETVSIGSHGITVTVVGQGSPVSLSGSNPFHLSTLKVGDIWHEEGRDVLRLKISSTGGFAEQLVEFDVDIREADAEEAMGSGTFGQDLGNIVLQPVASATVVLDVTGDVRPNERWEPICYTDSLTRHIRPTAGSNRITFHVKPGVHRLIISAPRHEAREMEITASADQQIDLTVELERFYLENVVSVPGKDEVAAILPPTSVAPEMNRVMAAYLDYNAGSETALDASIAIWNTVMEVTSGVRANQAAAWRSEDLAARNQEYTEWYARYLEERKRLEELLNAEQQNAQDNRDAFLKEWNGELKEFEGAVKAYQERKLPPTILVTEPSYYDQELAVLESRINLELLNRIVDPALLGKSELRRILSANPFDRELKEWTARLEVAEGAKAALSLALPHMEKAAGTLEEMFARGGGYLSGKILTYRHQPSESSVGELVTVARVQAPNHDPLAYHTAELYSIRGHLGYYRELRDHLSLLIPYLQKVLASITDAQQKYGNWLGQAAGELANQEREEAALEQEIARLRAERDSIEQTLRSMSNVQLGGSMNISYFPLQNGVLETAIEDGRVEDMQRYMAMLDQASQVVPTLQGMWDEFREKASQLENVVYAMGQVGALAGQDLAYTRPYVELSQSAYKKAAQVESWVIEAKPYVEKASEFQQLVEQKTQSGSVATEELAVLVEELEESVAQVNTLRGIEALGERNLEETVIASLLRLLQDAELMNSSPRAKDLAKRANNLLNDRIPGLKSVAPEGALDQFYAMLEKAWEGKDLATLKTLLHPDFEVAGHDYSQTVEWLERVFGSFRTLEMQVYQSGSTKGLRAEKNSGKLGQFVVRYSLTANGVHSDNIRLQSQEDVEDVLVVADGELKMLSTSIPLWARFAHSGGPNFEQVAVNHQPLETGINQLTFSREQLSNNQIAITGWVRNERLPITAVQVSTDAGASWKEASLGSSDMMVSFSYSMSGSAGQTYPLMIRAEDLMGVRTTFGGGSTYIVQVVADSTQVLANKALQHLGEAFTDGDIALFMNRVSQAFYPGYSLLESGIRQAIEGSADRAIHFSVIRTSVASWGVFVETNWTSKNHSGKSTLLFTPGWQLREIRGDVPFGIKVAELTEAAKYASLTPTKRGRIRLDFKEDKIAMVFAEDLFLESNESRIYENTAADGHFLYPEAMVSFNYGIRAVPGTSLVLSSPPQGQFEAERRELQKGQVFVMGNHNKRFTVLRLADIVVDWNVGARYVELEYIVHDVPFDTGYKRQ